jgi:hypothetical protein
MNSATVVQKRWLLAALEQFRLISVDLGADIAQSV